MITDEDYELSSLELALITQKFVIMQEWIKDIPDIVKFKDFIKYSSCTTQCYKHLLRVVVNSKSKYCKTMESIVNIKKCHKE